MAKHTVAFVCFGLAWMLGACDASCPSSTERVGDVCRSKKGLASEGAGAVAASESSMQSVVTTSGPAGAGGQSGVAGSANAGAGSPAAVGGAGGGAGAPAEQAGAPSSTVMAGAPAACSSKRRCWADEDQDGYATSGAKVLETCDECGDRSTQTEPSTAATSDCDDADKTRSPGATDICGDNIDNNCDGTPDNEATNACGGPCLTQLPGKPGDPCTNGLKGACVRKGTFGCLPDHTMACSAESVTGTQEVCGDQSDNDCDGVMDNGCVMNACGGWTPLARPPGTACSVGDGTCRSTGRYECAGTDDTTCNALPKPKNGCGGCGDLAHRPGLPCPGECGASGTWMCRGLEEVVCSAPPAVKNTCGGCTTLAVPRGTSCSGECGVTGRYECSGTDNTVCKLSRSDARNACGGCTPIPARQALGATCTAGINSCENKGQYICDGNGDTAMTKCNAVPHEQQNVCGGCLIFLTEPGTPCSRPDGTTGSWVCETTDTVICT